MGKIEKSAFENFHLSLRFSKELYEYGPRILTLRGWSVTFICQMSLMQFFISKNLKQNTKHIYSLNLNGITCNI